MATVVMPEDRTTTVDDWLIREVATILAEQKAGNRPVCMLLAYETANGSLHTRVFPDLNAIQDGLTWRLAHERPR